MERSFPTRPFTLPFLTVYTQRTRYTPPYAKEVTEYAALGPEPGIIVMFPGWLYHGVLPLVLPRDDELAAAGSKRASPADTVRISAAFNVVFEGHEPAAASVVGK